MQNFAGSYESTEAPKKKKISSADSPLASGEIGGGVEETEVGAEAGKEAMEIGADRIGVSAKEEEVMKTIADKERKRDAMLKLYKEKFGQYVQAREERAATQATLLRQKMARLGEGESLSAKDQAELDAYAANDAKFNEQDLYHAKGYMRDATDLQRDIDRLKDELERGLN